MIIHIKSRVLIPLHMLAFGLFKPQTVSDLSSVSVAGFERWCGFVGGLSKPGFKRHVVFRNRLTTYYGILLLTFGKPAL
jgi:hypothetical protein